MIAKIKHWKDVCQLHWKENNLLNMYKETA